MHKTKSSCSCNNTSVIKQNSILEHKLIELTSIVINKYIDGGMMSSLFLI